MDPGLSAGAEDGAIELKVRVGFEDVLNSGLSHGGAALRRGASEGERVIALEVVNASVRQPALKRHGQLRCQPC